MSAAAKFSERLRGRHAAVHSLCGSDLYVTQELAWWSESTRCWWLHGATNHNKNASNDPDCLHAGAEAMVLLGALARIDYRAFLKELDVLYKCRHSADVCGQGRAQQDVAVGFTYHVNELADLSSFAGCMYGIKLRPTPSFQDDVAWLEQNAPAFDGRIDGVLDRSVPVRLVISNWLRDQSAVCRQILQHVIAQQDQVAVAGASMAALGARFEISEVRLPEWYESNTIDALPFIVQLQERGVHFPVLPTIRGKIDGSGPARVALTRALRAIMSCGQAHGSTPGIAQVCVSNSLSKHVLSPFFSAVQASHTVKCVDLSVVSLSDNKREGEPEELSAEERETLPTLLRWTAYALFSRHAQHRIEKVLVNDSFLTATTIKVISDVCRADNPLASIVTNTTFNDWWIESSRFFLKHPDEAPRVRSDKWIFTTSEPFAVRVICALERGRVFWWKVLLPGFGEAWVRDDLGEIELRRDNTFPPIAPLYFSFDHLAARNLNAAQSLLLLMPHLVRGVDVEEFGDYDDEYGCGDPYYDMASWVRRIVRMCPHLERLALPMLTTIDNFDVFVNRSTMGNVCLRELNLSGWVYGDAVVDLLDALSDTTHPLTTHLESLHLHVQMPWESDRERDFRASWDRMLQQNRQLHTISVVFSGNEEPLECGQHVDVLRTGPLLIASKLAFLSVLQDPTCGSSVRFLDASVVSTVFQFAAQSHVRSIDIQAE